MSEAVFTWIEDEHVVEQFKDLEAVRSQFLSNNHSHWQYKLKLAVCGIGKKYNNIDLDALPALHSNVFSFALAKYSAVCEELADLSESLGKCCSIFSVHVANQINSLLKDLFERVIKLEFDALSVQVLEAIDACFESIFEFQQFIPIVKRAVQEGCFIRLLELPHVFDCCKPLLVEWISGAVPVVFDQWCDVFVERDHSQRLSLGFCEFFPICHQEFYLIGKLNRIFRQRETAEFESVKDFCVQIPKLFSSVSQACYLQQKQQIMSTFKLICKYALFQGSFQLEIVFSDSLLASSNPHPYILRTLLDYIDVQLEKHSEICISKPLSLDWNTAYNSNVNILIFKLLQLSTQEQFVFDGEFFTALNVLFNQLVKSKITERLLYAQKKKDFSSLLHRRNTLMQIRQNEEMFFLCFQMNCFDFDAISGIVECKDRIRQFIHLLVESVNAK